MEMTNLLEIVATELKNLCPLAVNIIVTNHKGWDTKYIRIDALHAKDYPNMIDDNSIFMEFKIVDNSVEVFRCGHVYLSPYDRANDFKYYAMRGMRCLALEGGVKKMRKGKYKTAQDLAKKLAKTFNDTMQVVERYTGGYPYKTGVLTTKLG